MRLEKKHRGNFVVYDFEKSKQPWNKWIHHGSHHHCHKIFLELVVQRRKKKAFRQRASSDVTAKNNSVTYSVPTKKG